ncbi:putative male reproductive-related protein B-like [Homarus americanus]|uniref:Putative male reproductive-related protein B-like n=1 Tax=Homarus americanus TaxID=6706 RepID=A0A8J5MMV0_HOMAM|nr:putative male reproductive-related protein B-like [Homarus americanus]
MKKCLGLVCCFHSSEAHPASSSECDQFQIEKEILKIHTRDKVSFVEAINTALKYSSTPTPDYMPPILSPQTSLLMAEVHMDEAGTGATPHLSSTRHPGTTESPQKPNSKSQTLQQMLAQDGAPSSEMPNNPLPEVSCDETPAKIKLAEGTHGTGVTSTDPLSGEPPLRVNSGENMLGAYDHPPPEDIRLFNLFKIQNRCIMGVQPSLSQISVVYSIANYPSLPRCRQQLARFTSNKASEGVATTLFYCPPWKSSQHHSSPLMVRQGRLRLVQGTIFRANDGSSVAAPQEVAELFATAFASVSSTAARSSEFKRVSVFVCTALWVVSVSADQQSTVKPFLPEDFPYPGNIRTKQQTTVPPLPLSTPPPPPPFGIPSTCICYPLVTELPEGFVPALFNPAVPTEPVKENLIGLDSRSRSAARAVVTAPTYVQVFKDDTVDPRITKYD